MPKIPDTKRKLSEDESFAQGLENITSSKSARPKRIYISKFQIGTLLLMSIPMAYGIQ